MGLIPPGLLMTLHRLSISPPVRISRSSMQSMPCASVITRAYSAENPIRIQAIRSATPAILTCQDLFGDLVFGSMNTNPIQSCLQGVDTLINHSYNEWFVRTGDNVREKPSSPFSLYYLFWNCLSWFSAWSARAIHEGLSKTRLQSPQLDCNRVQLSILALSGSNKLKTIYLCRVVTLVMVLPPAHQAGWWQVFTFRSYFRFSPILRLSSEFSLLISKYQAY